MSLALTKAAPLKPEVRLAQAISEFEASLSIQQKSTFRTIKSQSQSSAPTHGDVMRLTAEIDRQMSRKFSGQCFGPRFTNFLQGIQQFAALGDVVVGGSQNLIACGVWSLVRMSLLSIVSLSNYVDKLSSIFMNIGRTAPRHQAMALLYPRSVKLQAELNEYFVAVVELCHYLFKFGQKSTIQQFTSSLSDSRLTGLQADLDKRANSIKEEMHLLEAQENFGFRALAKGIFKSTSYQQRYATKMRVLDYCSTYDHVTTWKQTRKAGNTLYHKGCTEYADWKNCSHACTLIYTGKLGSGKSVLLANIVEDITLTTEKEKALVAYFFCRHDITESLLAKTIIGSFSRQLLCTVPDLNTLAKSCEDTHTTSDTDRMLDLLFQGFNSSLKVYFVLDGLDECDSKEKQKVVKAVREIQDKLNVSVCTSFRPEPSKSPRTVVDQLVDSHVLPLPNVNPDIETFVEASLTDCLDRGKLKLGDPNLIVEIQDALLGDSNGMFLWVSLQIQSLCSMHTDHAIREALADLPKDLAHTFSRILKRSGASDRSLQVKILQIVLAAYRPLTTDELREALSVTPGDTTWDPSKILNDVYSALACCGCLLCVDEEELTVRVVHHSFKQYVVRELEGTDCLGSPFEKAEQKLADIVVTYLLYGVFDTELSRSKARPIMAESAPTRVLYNTMESSLSSRTLAMRLLKSRKKPAFDMSRTIAEARGSFKSKAGRGFKFFAYAKAYWQDHIFYVSGKDEGIFGLSRRLIHSRMSEIKATAIRKHLKQCQWAVKNGNKNIIELLTTAGRFETGFEYEWTLLSLSIGEANPRALDIDGRMLLASAVGNGLTGVVEILLANKYFDVNATDASGTPLIILAVKHRDKEMVELLLGTGKVELGATDDEGLTVLETAVRFGYENMAKLLLSTELAAITAEDKNGSKKLLQTAISYRNVNMVELLLNSGVFDPDADDGNGSTPLKMAVLFGNLRIVELLLSTGAVNPAGKDGSGWTPLMHAAYCGWTNVAELVLSTGKADVFATNPKGETAQMLAKKAGHNEIVKLLQSHIRKARLDAHIDHGASK